MPRNRFGLILKWIVLFCLLLALVLSVPSLLGTLMAILLVYACIDYSSRRYRNNVKTFNAALRSVCHRDGAISKVALAFSRSGPLSGPCHEYTRRLMIGEDPVQAAVRSRVPLQLRTAVAMQVPVGSSPDPSGTRITPAADFNSGMKGETSEMELVESSMMPAYGQFIYLTIATLVTCVVLSFMSVFIVPTLEVMFSEFFGGEIPYKWMFSLGPAVGILMLLMCLILVIAPLLNRGHLFGFRLPSIIPKMPRLAERNAEILCGLADGIDAGWPLGRALEIGQQVSTQHHERRLCEDAIRSIQVGVEPIEAIRRVGWIDGRDAAWLTGATGPRTAQLLRAISAQQIRDARANLRWTMVVLFPVILLLLGLAVTGYAYGLFGSLSQLISNLA